jgi:hypothetical protein
MAAAAIRYAARRIGDRALLPTQAAVAVKEVQQSLLPRLFHSGKPAYAPRISPFSNPGRGRSSNAKVPYSHNDFLFYLLVRKIAIR